VASRARKSGLPAQVRFNGIPLTLRQPHVALEADFDVFENDVNVAVVGEQDRDRSNTNRGGMGSISERRAFPHEEVLVLSLPKHFLEPLRGFEHDNGLCMISSKILSAMRSTSFTAVVDDKPWINGFSLLPPHCILRSFLILDKSNNASQRHLSLSKNIYSVARKSTLTSHRKSSSTTELNYTSATSSTRQSRNAYSATSTMVVQDIAVQTSRLSLVSVDSAATYIKAMGGIRQIAFQNKLIPLFHYTSLNVASMILQGGLRMSTQGQGDGGVYFSTLGPASYGLGTTDYEINVIKDCFGVERVDEYKGKGKLDVIIVYACEGLVLQQVISLLTHFVFNVKICLVYLFL
jgi:hypothetical protein